MCWNSSVCHSELQNAERCKSVLLILIFLIWRTKRRNYERRIYLLYLSPFSSKFDINIYNFIFFFKMLFVQQQQNVECHMSYFAVVVRPVSFSKILVERRIFFQLYLFARHYCLFLTKRRQTIPTSELCIIALNKGFLPCDIKNI